MASVTASVESNGTLIFGHTMKVWPTRPLHAVEQGPQNFNEVSSFSKFALLWLFNGGHDPITYFLTSGF